MDLFQLSLYLKEHFLSAHFLVSFRYLVSNFLLQTYELSVDFQEQTEW